MARAKKSIKRESGLDVEAGPGALSPTSRSPTMSPSRRQPPLSRSGAPSVETRRRPGFSDASRIVDHDHEDEDCVQFMEVRPRIKTCAADAVAPASEMMLLGGSSQNNLNDSFVSNAQLFGTIGVKLKEMNETLGALHTLGIQRVASLPELVLVGDQSAGKSSLMSAISGLSLPSNDGTCTRCPLHVRLMQYHEWSCKVSIQQDYVYQPRDRPIVETDVTIKDPFPPWVPMEPRMVHEFKTIRDRLDSAEMENVLRWAQIAVLTPGPPGYHRNFVPKSANDPGYDREADLVRRAEAERQVTAQFSPNLISLEIKGPDLPDLSFYDLPGVFATARSREDSYLVRVVKNLTRTYIEHEGAIIILALPMNADPEVSSTFGIIRSTQGAESRTLGVMTKADLLARGAHAKWISMLKGESHQTGLGYYITSRKSCMDDLSKQNAQEEHFFSAIPADRDGDDDGNGWPAVFKPWASRCGVAELKKELSHRLAMEFKKFLPGVKAILDDHHDQLAAGLSKLPDMPLNPELSVRISLLDFVHRLKERIKSGDLARSWHQSCAVKLRDDVLALKPTNKVKPEPNEPFQAGTPVKSGNVGTGRRSKAKAEALMAAPNVISLDSDDNDPPPPTPTPLHGRKRRAGDVDGSNEPKRHAAGSAMTPTHVRPFVASAPNSGASFATSVTQIGRRADSKPRVEKRSLRQLHEFIQSRQAPGVPGMISTDLYSELCREAIQPWKHPSIMDIFVNGTIEQLAKVVRSVLDEAFGDLQRRAVFRRVKQLLQHFVDDRHAWLRARMLGIFELEEHGMFTLNEDAFNRYRDNEHKTLFRSRHHYRWEARMGVKGDRLRSLEQMSPEEIAREADRMAKEAQSMGRDVYETALDVAARVRGYYLTAAYRFIDNVGLAVNSGLFHGIVGAIERYLYEMLELHEKPDDDRQRRQALFNALMEEDAASSARRKQLKSDLAKVREALYRIQKLGEEAAAVTGTTAVDGDGGDGGPVHGGELGGGSIAGVGGLGTVGASVDGRSASMREDQVDDEDESDGGA